MSVTKEELEKQVQVKLEMIAGLPEKFRKPFCRALEEKKLILTRLYIRNDEVISIIVPFLNQNPDIHSVNLMDNRISEEGAIMLSKVKTLKILHLGNNFVGSIGAAALASNEGLDLLELCNNGVDGFGAYAIANNRTLSIVSLVGNHIDACGAKALAETKNTNLILLIVASNPINRFGVLHIKAGEQALFMMPTLRKQAYDKEKMAFLSVMTPTTFRFPPRLRMVGTAITSGEKRDVMRTFKKMDYMEETNEQKRKSLLFQYRNGTVKDALHKPSHRLPDDLLKVILAFTKDKPLKVMM